MTDLPANRITLITLGVSDLARSRAFYAALGWTELKGPAALVLYQMEGTVLALFDREALAADQGRPGAALGTGAATYAQNFPDRAAVDDAFARAVQAGAEGLKPPTEASWGGYSGHFADPDGHVWELAHNPLWPLDDHGCARIPQ
mgnify:FL=1